MDVFEAIIERRSIRDYKTRPIEKEKLMKLLQAARHAPSAKNRQNWKFIIITDEKIKRALVPACYDQTFIAQSPVTIAGVANPRLKWYRIDMGIAFEHIALEAMELGLGTCWIGAFEEPEVSQILSVPEHLETVMLMTIGYPNEKPSATPRKMLDEIVCYDSYC
jgi:nitroreductase